MTSTASTTGPTDQQRLDNLEQIVLSLMLELVRSRVASLWILRPYLLSMADQLGLPQNLVPPLSGLMGPEEREKRMRQLEKHLMGQIEPS